MNKLRRISAIAMVAIMVLNMNMSVFSSSPSASTWWPPGTSLLGDEDAGNPVESEEWDSAPIEDADKNLLGKGFLGTYNACLSQGEPLYEEMGNNIAKVLKAEGYSIPVNSRINPVGAFKVTPKQGVAGPYQITAAFQEVEMEGTDEPTYGTIVDMLSPSVPGQSMQVYGLHYKGAQQGWEVLKSPIKLSEINHDNMRIAYGTFMVDDLSPFYFFVVTNQLGTKAVELEKAQPAPQDKPLPPSSGMPQNSHQTGY